MRCDRSHPRDAHAERRRAGGEPEPSDGELSYKFGYAAKRERGVRNGTFAPINDAERRQAAEGPRGWRDLDRARVAE